MRDHRAAVALAAGLDGCRSGWVAAVAFPPDAGRLAATPGRLTAAPRTELRRFVDIDAALAWSEAGPEPIPMTVDIPIGLPATAGLRACDREARVRLGSRRMSVFPAPDRELFGRDFAAAREIVRARRSADPEGSFPIASQQSINITDKVAEVDRAVRARPARQQWLAECHPELSFRILAGRELASKRSAAGRAQRIAALATAFPDVVMRIEATRWPRREVARDDLLDAYAALWTALRFAGACGAYEELGDGQRDACGLVPRIVV